MKLLKLISMKKKLIMNNEQKQFWYVHNRASGNPTYRHYTYESALEEAKRLSLKFKKNFYVLTSVKKVSYLDLKHNKED